MLAVTRFDRTVHRQETGVWVERHHIIDVCQACDLPVSYKYERNIGSVGDAANYRDGVSLPKLFGQLRHAPRKAIDRLSMLRWALYQFIIRQHVLAVLEAAPYLDEEREFARGIAEFTRDQAGKLAMYAKEAVAIRDDYR